VCGTADDGGGLDAPVFDEGVLDAGWSE
jgi:hypothetical protein